MTHPSVQLPRTFFYGLADPTQPLSVDSELMFLATQYMEASDTRQMRRVSRGWRYVVLTAKTSKIVSHCSCDHGHHIVAPSVRYDQTSPQPTLELRVVLPLKVELWPRRIVSLDLSDTIITDTWLMSAVRLIGGDLQELRVSGCDGVTERGLCAVAEHCPRLKVLIAADSRAFTEDVLVRLNSFVGLRVLDVGYPTRGHTDINSKSWSHWLRLAPQLEVLSPYYR